MNSIMHKNPAHHVLPERQRRLPLDDGTKLAQELHDQFQAELQLASKHLTSSTRRGVSTDFPLVSAAFFFSILGLLGGRRRTFWSFPRAALNNWCTRPLAPCASTFTLARFGAALRAELVRVYQRGVHASLRPAPYVHSARAFYS